MLTGADVTKLIPIPDLSNDAFPEAKKFMDEKLHLKMLTFNEDKAYDKAALIWNGTHPEDGQPLEFISGAPEGHPIPELDEEPQLNAPGADGIDPQMFGDIAKKMGIKL